MNRAINRADRRRLEKKAIKLIPRIEEISARVEMMELVQQMNAKFAYQGSFKTGEDFAVCVAPDGLCYGERDADGFCSIEVYGPDGNQVYGYGGDSYDLAAEVCQQFD